MSHVKNCSSSEFNYFFSRHHLSTDMKDPELKFWTTKPNVFLIAVHEETKKVVGCISYREIASDTGGTVVENYAIFLS